MHHRLPVLVVASIGAVGWGWGRGGSVVLSVIFVRRFQIVKANDVYFKQSTRIGIGYDANYKVMSQFPCRLLKAVWYVLSLSSLFPPSQWRVLLYCVSFYDIYTSVYCLPWRATLFLFVCIVFFFCRYLVVSLPKSSCYNHNAGRIAAI